MIDDTKYVNLGENISIGILSPLADPVVEEIYKDEVVAGLAAESLIGAVLAECGERFGKVIELTPQKKESQLGNRSCYIDVFAKAIQAKSLSMKSSYILIHLFFNVIF